MVSRLLGFFCGITSAVPATLIRRFGVRACLLQGTVVMALAFLCLARANGLLLYFLGASLAGLGFTLLDSVPGTYLLSRLFQRPSFAIGLFFTIGGLGGVAGPLLYSSVVGAASDWRSYWLVVGALVAVTGVIAAFAVDAKTDVGGTAMAIPTFPPRHGPCGRRSRPASSGSSPPPMPPFSSAASPPARFRWRT